jgi:hypothetical protein
MKCIDMGDSVYCEELCDQGNGYGYGGGDDDEDEDEEMGGHGRLPPHELLAKEYARSQRTSFSVCEGLGRTLKGRDLSRVRNAVWNQLGFAD